MKIERNEASRRNADISAGNQMTLWRKKLVELTSIGVNVRIENCSMFKLGQENEPYTEGMIDSWMAELCGGNQKATDNLIAREYTIHRRRR